MSVRRERAHPPATSGPGGPPPSRLFAIHRQANLSRASFPLPRLFLCLHADREFTSTDVQEMHP